jgi:crotonobetainyl-CoA:carnitine CoA-transferase CaiB-like acyl-CoA transferase
MSASLLQGVRIVEVVGARGGGAARYLESLGAEIETAAAEAPMMALDGVDVLIGSNPADFRVGGRFDPEVLRRVNPRLVTASVTPFGLTGPYADFDGPEIVVSALGGCLGVVGYDDRPPVKEALEACGFHAEMMAAAGVLFALVERETSDQGQHVDVSVQEVAASRMTNGVVAWQFDHRLLERTGTALSYGKAKVRCVWDLADGYVFHSLMTGRFGAPANAALSAWMDEAGFDNPMRGVDWLTYDRSALDEATRGVWQAAMDRFFRSRTKAEMRTEGRRRGINACVVNEPADVVDDAQLEAREFWQTCGGKKAPGRFVRVVEHRENTSPLWGGAGVGGSSALADSLIESRRRTGPHPNPSPQGGGAGPLAGVRVLDFSWALVGSVTTKLLADFGAEVVKVESSLRPCLSRIDVQVAASKRGNFDDKPWFIHMNTSKQSLRLNAKHAGAKDVLGPLIEWADVVVENFSPGTMKSLGLDYATLSARRPDLVMVSGSVFGQTGPLAPEWGVDGTGAALSGRLFLTGWADRTPVTPSSVPYGDLLLPPMMAAAAAAGAMNARRTGRGCHVDASMYEACVQQMAPAILAAQRGAPVERSGNADPGAVLQEVFPASGGRWIALRVADEAAWARLGRLIGGEWGVSKDMLSAGRRAASEAHIRFWLERHDAWDAMTLLQRAGIAAGVVQSAADLVDRDKQLRARDFLVALDNPALGRFEHQASPIRMSRTGAVMRTAPGLGEHTKSIVTGIAGLSEARFAELQAAGVFE